MTPSDQKTTGTLESSQDHSDHELLADQDPPKTISTAKKTANVTSDPSELELIHQAGLFFWRAGSPRGQRKLLESADERKQKLSVTSAEYLTVLRRVPTEWDELWNLVGSDKGDNFFRFPTQFDLLNALLAEKAVTASDRTLKVLSAGCGQGYEPYSLALTLATSGLPAKGWNMSIKAFDLSNKLINRAKAGNFTLEDLRWLDPAVARRWFTLRAAGWHFRTELGPPLDFIKLNLADIDSNLKAEMQGTYDVIFCRGLSFDCPDHLVQSLARTITSLLAPWGLLFTAPGEIWLEMNDLTTEVRDGVVYGRKNGPKGKYKANVFHVP
ncbi:MAG: methyltransferase domain-containing protein, partial [Deltaproteobacteria bacterium]|nr:methyltransferase domain-containing protein [Deltaproteobacteria bacterium]